MTKSVPATIIAASSRPFRNRCPAKTNARLAITSASLPQAMTEPDAVTPPIRMDRNATNAVNVATSCWPWSAAQPTSRLAAPPEPLKSATISGMEVMPTRRATTAPITAPTMAPAAIHS